MNAALVARFTQYRFAAALAAIVLIAVAALVAVAPQSGNTIPLDPENSGPGGAKALAQVLRDHGVELSIVRSADALEEQVVNAETTVLVTSSDSLGASTLTRLRQHAGDGELIVVDPSSAVTSELALPAPRRVALTSPVEAQCDAAPFTDLEVGVDEALAFEGPGCFTLEPGSLLAFPAPGLTLWGAGQALSNEQILSDDNAAAALRLAGGSEALVWYVPDAGDLTGEDALSLVGSLPSWIFPGLWILILSGVGLVVWRSRRLGPLAVEPLPVVVKAVESTLGRGRLYHRAGDRGHAATALRAASVARLATRLRLGGHDVNDVVPAVAASTARDRSEIAQLLSPDSPAPTTDHELIRLAAQLATLEEEMGHA